MTGYFEIGVYHPKHEVNIGTLWRSAKIFGAAGLHTIGRRYDHQAGDTTRSRNTVPLRHYADIDELKKHLGWSCLLVGIEQVDASSSLPEFVHPSRALYLFGAEDHGLPPAVLSRCHAVVSIPTPVEYSMNVATAGGIVMFHRYLQRVYTPRPVGLESITAGVSHIIDQE